MNFFDKLLGKQEKISTPDAIRKLREVEDMLMKKQEYLERKIETELNIARKNASKNKKLALQALKRKRRYDQQLLTIDGTLTTIELQREALEGATTNTAVLSTMKNAVDALKGANKTIKVDDVNSLMDDFAEQQELAEEMANAVSQPIGFGNDVDEDDLERELEELEQMALDENLLTVPQMESAAIQLPSEHKDREPKAFKSKEKTKIKQSIQSVNNDDDEDEDLKELQMWAS